MGNDPDYEQTSSDEQESSTKTESAATDDMSSVDENLVNPQQRPPFYFLYGSFKILQYCFLKGLEKEKKGEMKSKRPVPRRCRLTGLIQILSGF